MGQLQKCPEVGADAVEYTIANNFSSKPQWCVLYSDVNRGSSLLLLECVFAAY